MIPIEQTSQGIVVFLKCGCAAIRLRTHPTGEAAAVSVQRPCDEHALAGSKLRFVPKGELVSPYVRTLLDFESDQSVRAVAERFASRTSASAQRK